ncbi:MAG: AAA family ATPase, partial [bacterium]
GTFTCVTGVSGSGKSSLVNEILFKSLAKNLNRRQVWPGKHVSIEGMEQLDKVIEIDQSPIGRTPRSNPATYTKTFDYIRDLFAETQMAKIRGYNKGRFSFNLKGGRCEACKGHGINKIEMHFLPDIYVPCEVCNGARYNRETLQVKYKDKTIADVLNMTVEQALEFFEHIPTIEKKLRTIYDVGLGYIKLGQPATQLSGGEAQRVKLATELSKRSTGNTIYLLDEPTTGLDPILRKQFWDFIKFFNKTGKTIIFSSHNLEEIEHLCNRIILMDDGKVKEEGNINEIKKKFKKNYKFKIITYPGIYENIVNKLNIKNYIIKKNTLTIISNNTYDILKNLIPTLNELNEELIDFDFKNTSLNEIFENIFKENKK